MRAKLSYMERDNPGLAMADLRQPPTSEHTIADHVHAALACFRLLLSNGALLIQEDNGSDKKTIFNALKESYGRFRVWISNIAVHRRDKTSLDYRLRGSPQIKLNIIKLLEDLREPPHEGKDHSLLLGYNMSSRKLSKL